MESRHAMIGGLAAVVKDVIPYGSVWGNHAHLEGLNLLGLKRRVRVEAERMTLRLPEHADWRHWSELREASADSNSTSTISGIG